MPDFSKVLLCSDFDHTYTTLKNEVHPKNDEAVRYFMEHGGKFSIASGRSVPLFRKPARTVPSNAPGILFNGAACYDFPTETLFYETPMPEGSREMFAELLRIYGNDRAEVQTVQTHYLFGEDAERDRFLIGNETSFVHTTDIPPLPWIKVALYEPMRGTRDPDSEAAEREEAMFQTVCRLAKEYTDDQVTVVRSMFGIVEIFSKQCSKGGAARWLANKLERPILVCVGDAPNDISMLEAADYGFRTGDCEPELKNHPFLETCPCGEGALAGVIERLEQLL